MEEIQDRHRKEQKDLQGRITQKKKNATKKTKKGVNDECERLQAELRDRQQREIDALSGCPEDPDVELQNLENKEETPGEAENLHLNAISTEKPGDAGPSHDTFPITQPPVKKPNRQRARLARRAAEQDAQAARAAEEAAKLPDLRKQEIGKMQEHFEKLGFKELSIRPDGHCMYSAVAMLLQDTSPDQQKFETGSLLPYQAVRVETARFISEHPNDFESFLEEPIERYTNKIKNTAEWGGQLELQAIARAYRIDINVLQADGRVEKIESGLEPQTRSIWLTYYRHSFGLGEHYNALKKIS